MHEEQKNTVQKAVQLFSCRLKSFVTAIESNISQNSWTEKADG